MSPQEEPHPFTCPQCGTPLVGPSGTMQAGPLDMVRCPVHGDVARLQDLLLRATAAYLRQEKRNPNE
jgi:uncharacterized Zn finger protein (UPF0148 family)